MAHVPENRPVNYMPFFRAGNKIEQHLQGEVLTTAVCVEILFQDGTQAYHTGHAVDVTYQGNLYLALTGVAISAVSDDTALNADGVEFAGIQESTGIHGSFILARKYDNAKVTVFMVNYIDPDYYGAKILRKGWLGDIAIDDNSFRAEVRGLSQALTKVTGRKVLRECDTDFASPACALNPATFTHTATVLSVTDDSSFVVTLSAPIVGLDTEFKQGTITIATGDNAGLRMEIKFDGKITNTTRNFVLYEKFPYDITVGTSMQVLQGCDKTVGTCNSRYFNVANFQGFPYITGPSIGLIEGAMQGKNI